jgi:hypothetical protein
MSFGSGKSLKRLVKIAKKKARRIECAFFCIGPVFAILIGNCQTMKEDPD